MFTNGSWEAKAMQSCPVFKCAFSTYGFVVLAAAGTTNDCPLPMWFHWELGVVSWLGRPLDCDLISFVLKKAVNNIVNLVSIRWLNNRQLGGTAASLFLCWEKLKFAYFFLATLVFLCQVVVLLGPFCVLAAANVHFVCVGWAAFAT